MTKDIDQLAMDYAIWARRPADLNTVQRFHEQNQRYIRMVSIAGIQATDKAITDAHEMLKLTEG